MQAICKGCLHSQPFRIGCLEGVTKHLFCPTCRAVKPHVIRPHNFKVEAFKTRPPRPAEKSPLDRMRSLIARNFTPDSTAAAPSGLTS